MNVHKNARMTVHGRLLLIERVRVAGWRVVDAAAAAGVSERTAYTWLARYRAGGERALRDRSSAPARSPRRLPAEAIAAIARLRRQRWSGPRIARALGRPVSTVGAVLRRSARPSERAGGQAAGGPLRAPRCRRAAPHRQQEARPDRRPRPPRHRRPPRPSGAWVGWEYLHVAIDDASRLAYTELLPDERGQTCAGFLARAAAWFASLGVRIERVMTDNAFAYTKSRRFRATMTKLGARHLTTRPYRPRTNGKAERFIQTALREWLYGRPYPSSADRATAMPAWLHWYNHHRPHAGINAATPASRLNNLLGNNT